MYNIIEKYKGNGFGRKLVDSAKKELKTTKEGTAIDVSEVLPGDLIFYSNGSTINHVAIYIGNGQIVHSANSRKGVIISDIYYDNTFIGIKNVID